MKIKNLEKAANHIHNSQCNTIGFIGNDINEEIPRAIWQGVVNAAHGKDINLIFFAGGVLHDPVGFGRQENMVYDLISSRRIDGLIVMLASIGCATNQEELSRFIHHYTDIPMICIEQNFEGIPAVIKDDYQGFRDVITHLVQFHGRRRIVFMQGPAEAVVVRERYRAYLDALQEYGFPFDPNLVTPPAASWFYQDAIKSFRNFLADNALQPRFDFDAVVAVNDENALAAINVLQSMGVRVPEDVSVAGFDDLSMAGSNVPPLTTVRQSHFEIGRKALYLLLDSMSGKSIPQITTMQSQLIIRHSCGCLLPSVTEAGEEIPAIDGQHIKEESLAVLLAKERKEIAVEMAAACGAASNSFWAGQLLNGFVNEIDHSIPGAFLSALDEVLKRTAVKNQRIINWHRALSVMRKRILPHLVNSGKRNTAEGLWNKERVMVGEIAWREQSKKRLAYESRMSEVWAFGARIALATDLDDLASILQADLPGLGIMSCYIALYENVHEPLSTSRLTFGYDDGEKLAYLPDGNPFPTSDILPDSIWKTLKQKSILIGALFFRDEPIGYVVLDTSVVGEDVGGELFAALQMQISGALKAISLHQQTQIASREAELGWRLAEERSRAAEEANQLKSRFLSMVSHELRTPLNVIAGLSENLMQQRDEKNAQLSTSFFNDLERIYDCAQHLNNLIRDVLDLASSHGGQLKLIEETLVVSEVLKPVLVMGERMAREKNLVWRVEIAEDLPKIYWDRTRFRQVVLNLITNAVKFTDRGEVLLRVKQDGKNIIVSIHDTGMGIPPEEQSIIFEEFRRSERATARGYGGLGLGLAICRRLVELGGGKIWVESSGQNNDGSTFYFTLPAVITEEIGVQKRKEKSQAILILTPNSDGNKLLENHLIKNGYEVVTRGLENTIQETLKNIQDVHPGAILLDLEPSAEQGWEVLSVIKNNPVMQDVPVLVYSLQENRDRGSVIELDYLEKPVAGNKIAQALEVRGLINDTKTRAVMIVDDDEDILELHSRMVETQLPGSRILLARNGKEALDLLRQQDTLPDLVMLDLMMPVMSGFEVLNVMRSTEALRAIPVIVLTSQKLSEEEMQKLSQGVAAVLSKGLFNAEETLSQVTAVMARHKQLGSEARRIARKAMAYIHEHYREPINRKDISDHISVSKEYLSSCFSREVGVTLSTYIERVRIRHAKELLETTDMNITKVATEVGFYDSSYFGRVFRREVGVSPIAYRRGESRR